MGAVAGNRHHRGGVTLKANFAAQTLTAHVGVSLDLDRAGVPAIEVNLTDPKQGRQ
jgi:hypothetical protein